MSLWTQYFPPRPSLTEADIGSQKGRVFIVTGGASGVGFELVSMLYAAGARVYLAGRSEKNGRDAITRIEQKHASKQASGRTTTTKTPADAIGTLNFLQLDLSDLKTVAPAAKAFLQREQRLDVLWNNAGVGVTFDGEESAQGLPVQLSTNCVGPLLFTQLLQPALERADGGARVVWAASAVVDWSAPKGGMLPADFEQPRKNDGLYNYTASKVGNWFLAAEFGRQEKARVKNGGDGGNSVFSSGADPAVAGSAAPSTSASAPSTTPILHTAVNPGNLRTAIWRTFSWLFVAVINVIFLYEARYGAYTMLWAGLSPELDAYDDNGSYIIPWGRRHSKPRKDILGSIKTEAEGGSGTASKFYKWCETQFSAFR